MPIPFRTFAVAISFSPTITYKNGFTEPKHFVLQLNHTTKGL